MRPTETTPNSYLAEIPAMNIPYWIVGNGLAGSHGEYVQHYQRAGATMHFCKRSGDAYKTTDRIDAVKWQRIANTIYKRSFKIIYRP